MYCKQGKLMEIYIGQIPGSPRREEKQKDTTVQGKKNKADRRRTSRDRRRSVREGIVVTLSIHNDRRSGRDRRNGSI